MKDLKLMRENFKRELELAKIENKFEKTFKVSCVVFHHNNQVHISCKTDAKSAGKILKKISADTAFECNETATGVHDSFVSFYRLRLHRNYREFADDLSIKFFNDGIHYEITLKIDKNFGGFFIDSRRKATESELDVYTSCRDTNARREISCRKFNCKQLEYYGGYFVCNDHGIISGIVNALMSL